MSHDPIAQADLEAAGYTRRPASTGSPAGVFNKTLSEVGISHMHISVEKGNFWSFYSPAAEVGLYCDSISQAEEMGMAAIRAVTELRNRR